MSATSALTTEVNAAPTMNPIARSTALPLSRNFLKPVSSDTGLDSSHGGRDPPAMRRVKPLIGAQRQRMASVVAAAQWGAIDVTQLADCGVSADAVKRWRAGGKLFLIHPGVYAYGHPWLPVEGRMVAAILHSGEGTVLSHATAPWVCG